jgi:hypothetical protein
MKANLGSVVLGAAVIAVLLALGALLYPRNTSPPSFEYRVCFVQHSRVTFVNNAWQGRGALDPAAPKASMDSCPEKWSYLAAAGAEGWELVGVAPIARAQDQLAQELFLKRTKR